MPNQSYIFQEYWKYNGGEISDRKPMKSRQFRGYNDNEPRFSWEKLILFILSTLFDVVVLMNIIFLVAGRISHVLGIILLLVSIGFSLLCKFLWRRSTAGVGAMFTLFIIAILTSITLCAYSGIEPLASLKDDLSILIAQSGIKIWRKIGAVVEYLRILLIEKG